MADVEKVNPYKRFVPSVLPLLKKRGRSIIDIQPGDCIEKNMSIVFGHPQGFSESFQVLKPKTRFKLLNTYLSLAADHVHRNRGYIDQYHDDGMISIFDKNPDDAIQSALSALFEVKKYNRKIKSSKPVFEMGFGVDTDTLLVGTIGNDQHVQVSVVGEAVDVATHLGRWTADYGASLLITGETYYSLDDPFRYSVRLIENVQVEEKSDSISIYEIYDADPPEVKSAKRATQDDFEKAISLYYVQEFREAQDLFEECLAKNPQDRMAEIYVQRCSSFEKFEGDSSN